MGSVFDSNVNDSMDSFFEYGGEPVTYRRPGEADQPITANVGNNFEQVVSRADGLMVYEHVVEIYIDASGPTLTVPVLDDFLGHTVMYKGREYDVIDTNTRNTDHHLAKVTAKYANVLAAEHEDSSHEVGMRGRSSA